MIAYICTHKYMNLHMHACVHTCTMKEFVLIRILGILVGNSFSVGKMHFDSCLGLVHLIVEQTRMSFFFLSQDSSITSFI